MITHPNLESFVEVLSGEICQGLRTADGKHFVKPCFITREGRPDKRAQKHLCQIYPSANREYFIGRFAPVVPEREAQAEPIRRQIHELHEQVALLQRKLCAMYCLPETQPA